MAKERCLKGCLKENKSVVTLNLIQGLPRRLLLRNSERGRSRIKYGMTSLFNNGNRAFTLIELLVVVLIIGILAAVAVPQYQKAVYKTQLVNAIALGEKIAQAEERYYLSNNTYSCDFATLDIDLPEFSMTSGDGVSGWTKWTNVNQTLQIHCYPGTDSVAGREIGVHLLKYQTGDFTTHYVRFLDRELGRSGHHKLFYTYYDKPVWDEIFKSLGAKPYSISSTGWHIYYLPE